MKEELIALTKKMVSISSVNGSSGEKEIGEFLESYFREIPYFKEHPEYVIVQKLKKDALERRNVFVLLRGEKDENKRTILFHGHTDTVGVEDFGDLSKYAFDCDTLAKKLGEITLPEEVKKDLESGDYLFGRGACDMKSGDAVFMVLIKHLSQKIKEFSGNILLSLNPVEENLHTGIIEGIEVIKNLKETYDLDYVLAINNDYVCPMYQDDPNRYIYTGVGGKMLPCFYVRGRETHVGQCFEGLDAAEIASKIGDKISLNPELSDGYKGEYSLPPTILKLKDLKPWYNVQTIKEALVYFNYFVHNAEAANIIEKLQTKATEAVEETIANYNSRYKKFCELSGNTYSEILSDCKVMTYEKLYELAVETCKEDVDKILEKLTKEEVDKGTDKREIPIPLIRELLSLANIYEPVVVLYFAAPYCPHNTLQDEDQRIIDQLVKITKEVEEEEGETVKICRFFPSLSDSSYLTIDDSEESIEKLKNNFPEMDALYPLPFKEMKELKMKAVNFGVYGKDAHKWTERLYVPYSFEVLPKLLQKALREFL